MNQMQIMFTFLADAGRFGVSVLDVDLTEL